MEFPSGMSQTSIAHLPDDCLYIIFQWLEKRVDRESFGLTCHRWLHIQNQSRRSLHFECSFNQLNISSLSQSNIDIKSFHLHRLLNRFQQLQSLSLSGCIELTDSGLTQLLFYGAKLKSLNLDCCFGITDCGLSIIASGCPSLMLISLYRCNISDIGLETLARSCSALKEVNLSSCSLITDRGVAALSQKCLQLLAIRISNCRNVNGVGFQGCPETLAYLEAESCKIEREGIMGIVSGGGLEYLNLSSLSWSVSGASFAAIGAGFATKLKILDLRLCRTIIDESVMAIAKECPLLQQWNLALCHEVRISGWQSIGSNCNNLEKLHVNRCRNLCDRGLQALRDGCQKLSVLYMSRCRLITCTAIELFKCFRAGVEIKEDEVMDIAPKWAFR
ncbi:Leucine-rich repeat [Dillenia turbinata]|uniref:Leucine-rich repeat n=1 Tax=Dillenia turbinata TaxID=194707 RepID=A0AAN8ZMT9_9MAGN